MLLREHRRRPVLYPKGYEGPICPNCTSPLEEIDHPRRGLFCPNCLRLYYRRPDKKASMHLNSQGGGLRKQQITFFPPKHKPKGLKITVGALIFMGLAPLLYFLFGRFF